MKHDPKTMMMYPKKSSAIWLLIGGIAFTAIGIWMGSSKGWIGYLIASFFSLCIPIAVIQLIPGSTFLKLDSNGFTICNLFRKTFVPWSAVQEFFVITMRQTGVNVHEMVGFNFIPSYDKAKIARNIAYAIGEAEGGLPDTYGRKAGELAEIMNSWLIRDRETGGEQDAALDFHSAALRENQ